MKASACLLSVIAALGTGAFVVVILALHVLQPGYDPVSQLMSELVFGRFGDVLVVAFLGLFIAAAANAINVQKQDAARFPALLLALAAFCFLGAGIVTLAGSAPVHVMFVAVAFIACGLCMYLLPRTIPLFSGLQGYLASWSACLVMCAATGLGDRLIAAGVAQRISAAALVLWQLFVAWRLAQ